MDCEVCSGPCVHARELAELRAEVKRQRARADGFERDMACRNQLTAELADANRLGAEALEREGKLLVEVEELRAEVDGLKGAVQAAVADYNASQAEVARLEARVAEDALMSEALQAQTRMLVEEVARLREPRPQNPDCCAGEHECPSCQHIATPCPYCRIAELDQLVARLRAEVAALVVV